MWPHSVITTPVSLATTGIENKHVVDISVSVAVIAREVNLIVQKLAGIYDHLMCPFVIPRIDVVASVIGTLLRKGDRPVDIKLRIKLPTRTFNEEIPGRAGGTVVGKAGLVQHP